MEELEKLRAELKLRGFSPLTVRNYSFFVEKFLIDCKTSADSTLPLIIKALEPHKDLILKNKLHIVISGNRPKVADYVKYPNWITFDGRSNEPVPSFLASHVELESEAFYKFGVYNFRDIFITNKIIIIFALFIVWFKKWVWLFKIVIIFLLILDLLIRQI
jgi:hypothetical protein